MKNQRRNILGLLGLGLAIAALPKTALSAVATAGGNTQFLNRLFVHVPEGKSVATANRELAQWANSSAYNAVIDQFKRDGRLLNFSITRSQNPFVVELEFASLDARRELIRELEVRGVFNETKRLELGYTMSEEIQTLGLAGAIVATQNIRIRA